MPKKPLRPKYSNQQIIEIIKEWIHSELDQKMLYLYLVKGKTQEEISGIVKRDVKTVGNHLREGEKEVFSHLHDNT